MADNVVIIGGAPTSLQFEYVTQDTELQASANQSSYTFSGANIGDASADRLVLVFAVSYAGASRSLSTATINGSAAEIYATITNGTTQCCIATVFGAKVASGTTADLAVTYSGSVSNCTMHVYNILTSQTAAAADYDTGTASGASSPQITLDSPVGGAIFAVCVTGVTNVGTGIAFTEADLEDKEMHDESRSAAAHKETPSGATGQTMTAVISGTVSNAVVVGVSISP